MRPAVGQTGQQYTDNMNLTFDEQDTAIAANSTSLAKIHNEVKDNVLHMNRIVSKYGALVGVIRINMPLATSMALTAKIIITSQANTANRLSCEIIVGFNPLANGANLPYDIASITGDSSLIKLIRIARTTVGDLPVLLIGDVGQNLPNCLVAVTDVYGGASGTPSYPKTGWTITTQADLVGLTMVGTIATSINSTVAFVNSQISAAIGESWVIPV